MTQAPPQAPAPFFARPNAHTRVSSREMALPAAAMWAFPLIMLATIAGVLVAGVPVSYASAAGVSLAVIWCSLRAKWMLATGFYFTYAALEGLYKYTTDFSSATYYLKPVLVIIMAFLWWLSLKIDGRRPKPLPLSGLVAILGCVGFVQAFHPFGSGVALGLAAMFLWYLAPTFFYFLVCNELKTALQARQILLCLLCLCTVISAFAAFQTVMGQSWIEGHLPGYARLTTGSSRWWVYDDAGTQMVSFRPASTTPIAGAAATWSFVGIMLACSFLIEVPVAWKRALMMGILMLNAIGLLVTAVRLFVVISIICIALLLWLTARSKRQLFRNTLIFSLFISLGAGVFAVGQVVSGGMLSRRYASTLANPVGQLQQDRGVNFEFLPVFVPQYPFGIGFQRAEGARVAGARVSNFLAESNQIYNRETQFNSITADLGVAGLLIFVALMSRVLSRAYRTQCEMRAPAAQQIAAVIATILIGYAISCLGGPSIQGSEIFYLMAALATALPAFPELSWQDAPGKLTI